MGPRRPFWIKQAVRCCRRCGVAGGERVPPAPLGWYFILYRSENLVRHWSKNKDGFCYSVTCTNKVETIEHILIQCSAYSDCKRKLYSLWLSATNPVVYKLVLEAFSSETSYLLQFILDCSVLPTVIAATQRHDFIVLKELFHFTRTWCFTIHRQRMKMLGRWNY